MSLGLYVIPTCFKKATIVLVPEKLQPHGNNLYCCTKIPTKIVTKLQDLGLDSHLCTWILNLLTGRPQMVQIGIDLSIAFVCKALPGHPNRLKKLLSLSHQTLNQSVTT